MTNPEVCSPPSVPFLWSLHLGKGWEMGGSPGGSQASTPAQTYTQGGGSVETLPSLPQAWASHTLPQNPSPRLWESWTTAAVLKHYNCYCCGYYYDSLHQQQPVFRGKQKPHPQRDLLSGMTLMAVIPTHFPKPGLPRSLEQCPSILWGRVWAKSWSQRSSHISPFISASL